VLGHGGSFSRGCTTRKTLRGSTGLPPLTHPPLPPDIDAAHAAGPSEDAAVNVHTLRHRAASNMLTGGVRVLTVSRMLGHSSVSVTGDIYSHITDDGGREAAAALARALQQAE
jgi:integrase